jgi:stage V sporulation protein G
MIISRVRIAPIRGRKLLAHAEIIIDDCFSVRDIRITRGKTGFDIEMPRIREGGRSREIAFALDAQTRKMIEQTVIAEYERVVGKRTR